MWCGSLYSGFVGKLGRGGGRSVSEGRGEGVGGLRETETGRGGSSGEAEEGEEDRGGYERAEAMHGGEEELGFDPGELLRWAMRVISYHGNSAALLGRRCMRLAPKPQHERGARRLIVIIHAGAAARCRERGDTDMGGVRAASWEGLRGVDYSVGISDEDGDGVSGWLVVWRCDFSGGLGLDGIACRCGGVISRCCRCLTVM